MEIMWYTRFFPFFWWYFDACYNFNACYNIWNFFFYLDVLFMFYFLIVYVLINDPLNARHFKHCLFLKNYMLSLISRHSNLSFNNINCVKALVLDFRICCNNWWKCAQNQSRVRIVGNLNFEAILIAAE